MRKNMTESELLERLAALPKEIAPEHDAWPAISSRIETLETSGSEKREQGNWWKWAAAASVFVAFASGLSIGQQKLSVPGQSEGAALVSNQVSQMGSLAATLAATELEYQAAFREFISVGSSSDTLPPRTVEKLVMSWDDLRQTETGLKVALEDNPDNRFLNSKMLELRSRQLEFLQQIAALDQGSRRTTI